MKRIAKEPNLKTEAIAGITTFFTMAYIVIVNPQILSAGGKTGMAFSGVLTATVLVCFTMTLLMGVYAKLPFAVAPGMGINAFFTFTIILGKGVPWPTALGIIFWAGIIFLLISATPIRESIAKAIPTEIRIAAAAGIGIFSHLHRFEERRLHRCGSGYVRKAWRIRETGAVDDSRRRDFSFPDGAKKPVCVSGRHRNRDDHRLGARTGQRSVTSLQSTRFQECLFQARHPRRFEAELVAVNHLDSFHRPIRFPLDIHRRRARRQLA